METAFSAEIHFVIQEEPFSWFLLAELKRAIQEALYTSADTQVYPGQGPTTIDGKGAQSLCIDLFNRVKQVYELTELVRMFLPPSEFCILEKDPLEEPAGAEGGILIRLPDSVTSRDDGKRYLYDCLKDYTGRSLDWGTLTGVRPVKLVGDLLAAGNTPEQVRDCLVKQYYLSPEKAELLINIRNTQHPYLQMETAAIGVYIGIPFCPTRCIYCSFPSNQVSYDRFRLI